MWFHSSVLIICYCSYHVDAWISCSTTSMRSVGFRSTIRHNCDQGKKQQNLALFRHFQQRKHYQDSSITNTRRCKYEERFTIFNSLHLLSSSSSNNEDSNDLGIRASADEYREYGNEAILRAVSLCGITDPNDISIQWKTNKIIVCIQRNDIVVSTSTDEEEDNDNDVDDDDLYDDEDNDDDDDVIDDDDSNDDDDDDVLIMDDEGLEDQVNDDFSNSSDMKIDLVKIARTINEVFDDGNEIGILIAEKYEIEVTTPGSSDEIIGSIMFRAYRGFDVTVTLLSSQQNEDVESKNNTKKKKNDKNIIEGKLVERTEDNTIINMRGRMKTISNDKILSVTLPKAKKE